MLPAPPSDNQIANESSGELGPAERIQPMPHAGEEFGASGLAECVSAGLRGQVGEVALATVGNLEGIAQARHLFKETPSLGREVPESDLFGRWRRAAFKSHCPVVLLHIRPEALGVRGLCPKASGLGYDTPGSQQLVGLGVTKWRVDPVQGVDGHRCIKRGTLWLPVLK